MSTQRGALSMVAAVAALTVALLAIGSTRLRPEAANAVVLRSEISAAVAPVVTSPRTGVADQAPVRATLSDEPEALNQVSDEAYAARAPRGEPQPSTGRLRFVYFVEQGEEFDESAVGLIEQQAAALQQFWHDEFAGTFYLPETGVDVVYGAHTVEWYDATVNGDDARWYRLLNMQIEVLAALGASEDDDVRMIVYPSARLDGRVGANRYGSAWMDGDDLTCIGGDVATIPYSNQFPANCLTTVAHELGHVYGLGHDGEEADCMQLGFYRYVNGDGLCTFSDAARRSVRADPGNRGWLDATPGERR